MKKSYNLLAILFNKPITVFDVDVSVVVPTAELREEAAIAVFDEEVWMVLRSILLILSRVSAVSYVLSLICERLACWFARPS